MLSEANKNIAEAIFSSNDKILDNEHQFKIKLKIDDKANKYLANVKKITDLAEASAIGVGTAAITNAAWYSSLGILGKAAVAIGISSTPVGWIVGAGVVAAAGVYSTKKLIKAGEKVTTHTIPKYLDDPLNFVACATSDLLLPPSISIACSDGDFCVDEKDFIMDYFMEEFGYNCEYLQYRINTLKRDMNRINYRVLKDSINTACNKFKDLKNDLIFKEIILIMQDIASADGKLDPNENYELRKAKTYLK